MALTHTEDENKEYLNPVIIDKNKRYGDINKDIASPLESFPTKLWWWAMAVAGSLFVLLFVEIALLIVSGIGILGVNVPVSWGSFIVTFVFWIGIGHAGTLISASVCVSAIVSLPYVLIPFF